MRLHLHCEKRAGTKDGLPYFERKMVYHISKEIWFSVFRKENGLPYFEPCLFAKQKTAGAKATGRFLDFRVFKNPRISLFGEKAIFKVQKLKIS